MDRTQILLIGFPLFLFFSDIANIFTPRPPSKPTNHHLLPHHNPSSIQTKPQLQLEPHIQQPLYFPDQKQSGIGSVGFGDTVNIDFCTSCSYKGTAVTVKKMLESEFPGINVVLANYPPALPKRIHSKVVPMLQLGVIGIIAAGEHIFPRLGMAPPPWYYSLRANRFRSMASIWLLGNFVQSFLQSSGAFEVYCNGDLIFSKLKENRFPGEIELRELVGRRLGNTQFGSGAKSVVWP